MPDPGTDTPPDSGVSLTVPTGLLSTGDQGSEVAPQVGDTVTLEVEATVASADGGNSILNITTVNGQPLPPTAPSDDGEAEARQMGSAADANPEGSY